MINQNNWEIISPTMFTTMLGTTMRKPMRKHPQIQSHSIFWFCWIYWVAVGRLTGFDKVIKVV